MLAWPLETVQSLVLLVIILVITVVKEGDCRATLIVRSW